MTRLSQSRMMAAALRGVAIAGALALSLGASGAGVHAAGPGGARSHSARPADGGTVGVWKPPQTVNLSGAATELGAVSCGAPGYCSAGGQYRDGSQHLQAVVLDEVNGVWGQPQVVPGTASLNTGGDAQLLGLDCTSDSACTGIGDYSGSGSAFVVDRVSGVWQQAQELPGLAALSANGQFAQFNALSCSAPGYCAVIGSYSSGGSSTEFFDTESNGTWNNVEPFPKLTVNAPSGYSPGLSGISCGATGDCTSWGQYTPTSNPNLPVQSFVTDESGGTWGDPYQVVPAASFDAKPAAIGDASCWAAGDCSRIGAFMDSSGNNQAMVQDESNGSWGQPQEIAGVAGILYQESVSAGDIACAPDGTCAAAIGIQPGTIPTPPPSGLVATRSGGTWGSAGSAPGGAVPTSLSCTDAGNCSGASGNGTVNEVAGSWDFESIRGLDSLGDGKYSILNALSCAAPNDCTAVGAYEIDSTPDYGAFLTNRIGEPVLTVTLNVTQDYGTTPVVSGLAPNDPDIGYTPSGEAPNVTGTLDCGTSAQHSSPVSGSPYSIFGCSGLYDSNYAIEYNYANSAYTVDPAPLTIAAGDVSSVYGAALPSVGWSAGFVNGDTAGSLTSQPSCQDNTTAGSPAGKYATVCSGAADPNYDISYKKGTLTITKAALTIDPESVSAFRGHKVPAIPWTANFVNGDTGAGLTAQPACDSAATLAGDGSITSPAALYTITCSGASDPNYATGYLTATLIVSPEPTVIHYTGPAAARRGKTLAVSATLLTDTGKPLAGRTVTFTLGTAACSGQATSAGAVACSVKAKAKGRQDLLVSFQGDPPGPSYDYLRDTVVHAVSVK